MGLVNSSLNYPKNFSDNNTRTVIAYGALSDPSTSDNKLYTFPSPNRPLPPSIDLRLSNNPDISNPGCYPYFNAFKQGDAGTCTSQAAVAAWMCAQRRQGVTGNKNLLRPSVLYNYYYARKISGDVDYDSGTSIHAAVQALRFGVALNSAWPDNDRKKINVEPNIFAQQNAQNQSAIDVKPIRPSLTNLKRCLSNGIPFIMSFRVTKSLDQWFRDPAQQKASSYVANVGFINPTEFIGSHTVLVIGYNDSGPNPDGTFLCRNSWGPEWGLGGHFYISYPNTIYPEFTQNFHIVQTVCPATAENVHQCVPPNLCRQQFPTASFCNR